MVRELVGALVQFAIVEMFAETGHGDGAGRTFDLLLEKFVDASSFRLAGGRRPGAGQAQIRTGAGIFGTIKLQNGRKRRRC